MFRLVGEICVGGGGVSQKLPADNCVGMESGGAVPSMVSGTCCDTASVLRVIVMSCPRLVRSGGVLGRRRSVSSAATSVALVGICPVTIVSWSARRLSLVLVLGVALGVLICL